MKMHFEAYQPSHPRAMNMLTAEGCQSPVILIVDGFFAILNRHYDSGSFFGVGPDGVAYVGTVQEDSQHHNSDTDSAMFRGVVRHLSKVYNKPIPAAGDLFNAWKRCGNRLSQNQYVFNHVTQEWINVRND